MHYAAPLSIPHTNSKIRILILVTTMLLNWPCSTPQTVGILAHISIAPSSLRSQPPFLLEFAPSLHRNLRAVELAFVFNTRFLGLLTSCLSSITPGEVVEFPEGVNWEDKVPDWEGEQVDEHPDDVRPAVSCKHNEHSW